MDSKNVTFWIIMVVVGLIAIGSVTAMFTPKDTTPEKEKVDVTEKDTSRLVSDEEMDRRLAGFEESYKALEKSVDPITITLGGVTEYQEPKQEATSIQKSKGLPASCNGVDSTETWLYPTAEKCMKELGQGYRAWCLSETKGDKAKTDLCVIDIASRLIRLCEDTVLSSPEVCLMYNMKYIYRQMMSQ